MDNLQPVVNEEPTIPQPSEGTQASNEEVVTTPVPGDKTDPNLLLKSLHEEREKRRILQEELESIKTSALTDASDEGRAILAQVHELKSELAEVKQDKARAEILLAHPMLKDKWEDFESFRQDPDNKGMNMRTAAKAFLVDNGLYDQPRKGLEKPTGGTRTPVATGMTLEDVKHLRENNGAKYREMLINKTLPNFKVD